jgi:lipoprotein-anchoring transpeptidase ErfK/SrfK
MFMVKLAAFACILSVIVVGISVFLLNMSDKAGRRDEERRAKVETISADLPGETGRLEPAPVIEEGSAAGIPSPSLDMTPGLGEDSEAKTVAGGKKTWRRPKEDKNRPNTVVLIDKKDYRLTVVRNGTAVKKYNIAVGKNIGDKERRGDMRTPEGEFKVQQFQDASSWKHDFGDGMGNIKGAYGPLFIRLSTPPWSGIGIHGTHDPLSIGSNATEGCVRMKNEELLEFAEMVDVGTRVIIRP